MRLLVDNKIPFFKDMWGGNSRFIDDDPNQAIQIKGFDLDLCSEIYKICEVPLVISGGMGKIDDIIPITQKFHINGLAAGSVFHYENLKINNLKKSLLDIGCQIRK